MCMRGCCAPVRVAVGRGGHALQLLPVRALRRTRPPLAAALLLRAPGGRQRMQRARAVARRERAHLAGAAALRRQVLQRGVAQRGQREA